MNWFTRFFHNNFPLTVAILVAVIVFLLLSAPGGAQAAHEDTIGFVQIPVLCGGAAQVELVESVQESREAMNRTFARHAERRGCVSLGQVAVVSIFEIMSGPHMDYDGDEFYSVRVGHGAYAILWPEFNYQGEPLGLVEPKPYPMVPFMSQPAPEEPEPAPEEDV